LLLNKSNKVLHRVVNLLDINRYCILYNTYPYKIISLIQVMWKKDNTNIYYLLCYTYNLYFFWKPDKNWIFNVFFFMLYCLWLFLSTLGKGKILTIEVEKSCHVSKIVCHVPRIMIKMDTQNNYTYISTSLE
jgi:hypothetical protein